MLVGLSLVTVLVVPLAGTAALESGHGGDAAAVVPPLLLAAAQAHPDQSFDVIVQSDRTSQRAGEEVRQENGNAKHEFASVDGVSATLTGKDLLKLAKHSHLTAITPDAALESAAYEDATAWPLAIDDQPLGSIPSGTTLPGIAIVDSGIMNRKELKAAVHVNLSSLSPGASGDGEGHGTIVAALAAGGGHFPGVANNFPLVDLRTADAQGQSLTSDVISACDWIIANKAQYNVRVANFSLAGNVESSFRSDPLDRAIEKLWFNGIVVVTAGGNQGSGTGPVPIAAPANDPFAITVGALDIHSTAAAADDTVAPWSAYGHTFDGFEKPELSAPGRYLIAPVPSNSTLPQTFPARIVDPAYPTMWMSGTSFSAAVVTGAAATIVFRHPDWSPGQVKGALMLAAHALPSAGIAAGVGSLDVAAAVSLTTPPNANENLDPFVVTDPVTGQKSFDSAGWTAAVISSPAWTAANWTSANWTSANWATANWAAANWTSASTSSANWAAANWTTAGWAE